MEYQRQARTRAEIYKIDCFSPELKSPTLTPTKTQKKRSHWQARKRTGQVPEDTNSPKTGKQHSRKSFLPWKVNSEDIFEIDFHCHDGNINWESLDSIVTENQKTLLTLVFPKDSVKCIRSVMPFQLLSSFLFQIRQASQSEMLKLAQWGHANNKEEGHSTTFYGLLLFL